MNKQIEEMAQVLKGMDRLDEARFGFYESYARTLYNAGYRKQSEGEWKKANEKYPRYVCTDCNHLYNNKEYKYCPNCGARMSGGKNE